MDPSPLSPPLLLALARLRRTDAKALFRAAVRDLIERRVLTMGGGRGQAAVVTVGPERAPAGQLPGAALRLVLRTPPVVADGGLVRDLSEVARGFARDAAARRDLVQAALDDLVEGGWATVEDRRVLGVPRRPRYRRSAAGDAALAARPGPADGSGGGDAVIYPVGTGTGGGDDRRDHEDDDRSGDLDDAFDTSFDTSSFDTSFAGGYADGGSGGDGGGGDGGGGDGGGGGD